MIPLLSVLTVRNVGVYARALATGLIQKDLEQIVAIVLAATGAERRKAEANPEGELFIGPERKDFDSVIDRPGDVGLIDQDIGGGDRNGPGR